MAARSCISIRTRAAVERRVATSGARGLFVTGTDTGIGKTHVACALLRALVAQGLRAAAMKPVAAGVDGDGRHADVVALRAAANVDAAADAVNPYAFAPAIAPHVAAALAGTPIDLDVIAARYRALAARADAVVVEGAGGVLVPLAARLDVLDIPARLALPVVLVVGLRLGAINHALLSALAIRARGLTLAGWVVNRIDPAMAHADASVAAIAERLGRAPAADLAFGVSDVGPRCLPALGLARMGSATDPC
jgi:dethiobiotin synthetase